MSIFRISFGRSALIFMNIIWFHFVIYARGNTTSESIKRVIEPISILFSEYCFYINAYIVEKDDSGKYVHKYNYPAIFRIDRIKNYKHLNEKFGVEYINRFEEGEFRKRV